MSMDYFVSYGYGFLIEALSEELLVEFCKNHRETLLELQDYDVLKFIDNGNPDADIYDKLEDYECENSYCTGALAIISNVMSHETNLPFRYEDADLPAIQLCPGYPWEWGFQDVARISSEEALRKLVFPYAKELSLTGSIGFQRCEYY